MYVSLLHSLYSSDGALQSPDYAVCVFHSDRTLSNAGLCCATYHSALLMPLALGVLVFFRFNSVGRFALHVPHQYAGASCANRISDNRDYLPNFNDFTAS